MHQLDLFATVDTHGAPVSRDQAMSAGFRLLYGAAQPPPSEPADDRSRERTDDSHDVED